MASLFGAAAARMLATAGPRSAMRQIAAPMFRPAMVARRNVASRVWVAAFHTTKKMQILPAGPQVIEGDVNTPAPVPDPNPVHGSYHWSFERIISAALIPLTIAPFAAGSLNPIMDAALAATVVIHSHIGFESCIIDYIPRRSMAGLHRFMRWLLNGCTALVLLGLYEFETNDVGITEAIKRIWKA
ncbi:succinate dehydrogenase membrane anchor subunit [Tirmania nivea]|nr:succinate dehydrogenase membrane anchor subunit [Tirmania nivea]